ncbi:hypothetical protein O6H91_19G038400 [Diphasiastrum complanatum]|uniref:Uncharacterized protein n=1 Tax=Diphasiastrum complanatum TaxID=34168 RepID=A0ACC2AU85_DIPCM|nr:hypothetical protein O6H91_Y372500 [Diphasiastrum complanatum]KAJ7521107.1 hypothetical protein O6H91_19G038400 [Diphasiastrum complanatum]
MVQRLSGLQRQVLSLYRSLLRAARLKSPEARVNIEAIVSSEFRKQASSVDKKDFVRIEHLLRKGTKQLEMLNNSSTDAICIVQLK